MILGYQNHQLNMVLQPNPENIDKSVIFSLSKKNKQVGLEVPHSKSKSQSGEYITRKIYMVGVPVPC